MSTTELLSEEQKSFLMDLGMKDGPLHLDFDKALKQVRREIRGKVGGQRKGVPQDSLFSQRGAL